MPPFVHCLQAMLKNTSVNQALGVGGAVLICMFDGFSLQGGVSDEVTLSAYITAAFLEINASVDVSTPRSALKVAVTVLGVCVCETISLHI